jgi:hypothetical protein
MIVKFLISNKDFLKKLDLIIEVLKKLKKILGKKTNYRRKTLLKINFDSINI